MWKPPPNEHSLFLSLSLCPPILCTYKHNHSIITQSHSFRLTGQLSDFTDRTKARHLIDSCLGLMIFIRNIIINVCACVCASIHLNITTVYKFVPLQAPTPNEWSRSESGNVRYKMRPSHKLPGQVPVISSPRRWLPPKACSASFQETISSLL